MEDNFVVFSDSLKVESKVFVEAFLSHVFFLVTISGRIVGNDKYGLNEAFAMILCDQIDHTPLNPRLPFFAEKEVFGIEGLIVL